MLAILKAGPASSKDLATQLGVHQVTITDWAKRLASKGKIIRRRESGIYPSHPFLYALPEHEALLEEKLGKPITDLIKKQLSEPKTASELFELIPKYTPRAISDNLRQLAQEGKLIFRIKKGKRVYALPQQEQRLEEITIVSIDISILSLLKENPRLWIREIARRLEISTATATKYLEQLVEEGKLTRTKFGCVFYELAGDA